MIAPGPREEVVIERLDEIEPEIIEAILHKLRKSKPLRVVLDCKYSTIRLVSATDSGMELHHGSAPDYTDISIKQSTFMQKYSLPIPNGTRINLQHGEADKLLALV